MFQEAAKVPSTLDERLSGIIRGTVDDTCRLFSNKWIVFEEVARSVDEYLKTGSVTAHINLEDGPMSWRTETAPMSFLQYLLIFHRRAFLFMVLVPENRAHKYLLDRNPLVRCLAKWRVV